MTKRNGNCISPKIGFSKLDRNFHGIKFVERIVNKATIATIIFKKGSNLYFLFSIPQNRTAKRTGRNLGYSTQYELLAVIVLFSICSFKKGETNLLPR